MKRSGFTLMELLVVIGLITILMALSTMAYLRVVSGARESNTKATLLVVAKQLTSRRSGLDRYFDESDRRAGLTPPAYFVDPTLKSAYIQSYRSGNVPKWLLTIGKKDFYRRTFPQTFKEAGIATPANHDPITESSECLYQILYDRDWLNVGEPDLSGMFLGDTDNDGLMEILDGWGQPLRFYRWPTRLFRPQPPGSESNPMVDIEDKSTVVRRYEPEGYWMPIICNGLTATVTMLGTDTDDGFGLLLAATQQNNPLTGGFAEFERRFHTLETFHKPIAISAGEDGKLGFYEPTNRTEYGYLCQPNYDNRDAVEDDISTMSLW